jgi:two-component system chemotaxis sensor kinase CheA
MFHITDSIEDFNDGMMIMIEQNETKYCLFCDSLLGLQQVVVKALPKYLKMINKMRYFGGCTLLGDGTISLILDLANITCHLN